MAQLKDLIVNGPSRFIGDVYATTFTGDLNGNANTATSATTAAALTGKTLVTASAVTTSNWPTYGNNHIPTMSFMAYWNGAYSGTSSNLTYCAQGAIIGSNNIGNQSVKYATTSGSCSGNAATAGSATSADYANEIARKSMLDSQEKIDNFITANRLEYATFKTTDANNVDFAGNDGMILSIPWTSTAYGAQIAFDDSTYGTVKVRGKSNTWGNWYTLLHSGNYTSYTVKKDGTGATGTWGINISGNAAKADTLDGYHASSFSLASHTHSYIVTQGDTRSVATVPSDYKNKITFAGLKANTTIGRPASTTYSYVVGLRGWSDSSGGKAHELAFNDNGIFHRIGATDTWEAWAMMLTTSNYNSYVPSLTGSGASGTWGINITGNAATATKIGTSTVGSTTMPVYIKSGAPTAITSFPEAYLSWGGKNFAGSCGPIDAAMIPDLGADRKSVV